MNIIINYYCKIRRENQLRQAVNKLNGIQRYYYFILKPRDTDVCPTKKVNWIEFNQKETLGQTVEEYNIFITEKQFEDNWFSHEESQYAIISTYGWERHFAPPSLKTYLEYQIAQAAIQFELDIDELTELRMVHHPSVGCLFDFCENKDEIKLGMKAGVICQKCKSELSGFGINQDAVDSIEKMLSLVRAETIGKPILLNENDAFIVMRYSRNDENDNSYRYGIKPALEKMGINVIRADSVINSGQLLEKIKNGIERSHFVIVKVDSENLNVYFELGLAMGLGKDVLLISNRDFILQLPSDLKNWECLTYTSGDYDELSEKIKRYYMDNYHYTC